MNKKRREKCKFMVGNLYIEITAETNMKDLNLYEFIHEAFKNQVDKEQEKSIKKMSSYKQAVSLMKERQEVLQEEIESKKIEWEYNHPGMLYHQRTDFDE